MATFGALALIDGLIQACFSLGFCPFEMGWLVIILFGDRSQIDDRPRVSRFYPIFRLHFRYFIFLQTQMHLRRWFLLLNFPFDYWVSSSNAGHD